MSEQNIKEQHEQDKEEMKIPPFLHSPVVVGDMVSIRKWINTRAERSWKGPAAGRVVRVWRGNSTMGIMVRVRLGFFKYIELGSNWVTVI